jgi:hypothetical protein
MNRSALSVFVIALLLTVMSCSSDDDNATVTCGTQTISFATKVSPIIQANCATSSGCHSSGSSNGPGPLLTYAQISGAKTSIKSAVSNGSMPRGGSLSSDDKNSILCWIENGAANN